MGRFIDYTGQKINKWNIVKQCGFNKHGESMWDVVCDCKNEEHHTKTLSSIKRNKNGCNECKKKLELKKYKEKYIGKKFGKLTIVDYYGYRDEVTTTTPYWIAKCDCGSDKDIIATMYDIKNYRVKSCGCSSEKKPDMDNIDKKYGKLKVCSFYEKKNHKFYWLCECDCGNKNIIVDQFSLKHGLKQSCGCIKKEVVNISTKSISRKKYNDFIDMGDYYIGKTDNGEFLFDKEDYEKVISINRYWKINNSNYVLCNLYDSEYQLHRYLMGLGKYDENKKIIVDHINGDRLDCRKNNLRICDKSDNAKNCSIYSNNTSGVKGVSWYSRLGKWGVSIQCNGKPMYLGVYSDKEEAIRVRKEAEIKYFGEFRREIPNE